MTEIKFRAWDKDTKQMITDFSVRSDGYVEVLEGDGRSGIFMRQDFVLMQYTGLKDKNGVEIYEGDIVKTAYRYTVNGEYDGQYMGIVEWNNASFEITWYGNDPDANFYDSWLKNRLEIIGNIHENPELLEANE